MITFGLWSACTQPAVDPIADPTAWMVRASLDLRGVRPSVAELDQLERAPDSAPQLLEQWMDDPAFELRVRDLFSRVWRTRVDEFVDPDLGGDPWGMPDSEAFHSAVGDEPLVMISRVVAEGRPYTDIVTSPTTYVNERLVDEFPVEVEQEGGGWVEARYVDGRPMAGVLSTNGLWWRYLSVGANYNRGRANALSRILLCSDFAARPVTFSVALGALDEDRTQEDPSCLSCHAGLDPLAGLLYGFRAGYTPFPTYSLANERDWLTTTGVEPGFFGEPVSDLEQLGVAIASDPRFLPCAVEQVYTGLYGIEPSKADPETLARHLSAFVASGAQLDAVYRSIVTDPAYAAAERRLLPIESVSAQVKDLTGYRWEVDGADMLGSDTRGLRTLGGGMDGRSVIRAATTPSATTVLVVQRLSELAAPWAVAHDAERPEEAQLFGGLDFTETLDSDRDEIEAAIDHLVVRALARRPTGPERDALVSTWEDAAAIATAEEAWAAVLATLIQDPEFVLY